MSEDNGLKNPLIVHLKPRECVFCKDEIAKKDKAIEILTKALEFIAYAEDQDRLNAGFPHNGAIAIEALAKVKKEQE